VHPEAMLTRLESHNVLHVLPESTPLPKQRHVHLVLLVNTRERVPPYARLVL
jgi:hypothetical protein